MVSLEISGADSDLMEGGFHDPMRSSIIPITDSNTYRDLQRIAVP